MKAYRLILLGTMLGGCTIGTINVTNPNAAVELETKTAATVDTVASAPEAVVSVATSIPARAFTPTPPEPTPIPPVVTPTPTIVTVAATANPLVCEGIAREMRQEMNQADRASLSMWDRTHDNYDENRASLMKDINDRYALRWLAAGCGAGFPTPNPDPVTAADRVPVSPSPQATLATHVGVVATPTPMPTATPTPTPTETRSSRWVR